MKLVFPVSPVRRQAQVTSVDSAWVWLWVAIIVTGPGCQRSTSPTAPTSPAPATRATANTASDSSDTNGRTDGPNSVASAASRRNPPSEDVPDGDAAEQSSSIREASADASATSEAIEVVFEDIQLLMQPDVVFRPFMLTDRVKELEGKRIRISGFMLPDSRTKGIRQFVLLKNTECKFGPGGQADHLVNVEMAEGITTKFRDDAIAVEGVLTIDPFQGPDGNTWSIYNLACDLVETYRPRR